MDHGDPELLGSHFMLSLERILLVDGAGSQIECPFQLIIGAAVKNICVIIFPSP